MRFIIREQEYEKLLAAGRLKYRSGALESWRLTEAIDGYMVMRVDLDERDVVSVNSTLFHLLLDSEGQLERAKIRDFSAEGEITVDVLVEQNALSISRADAAGVAHDQVDLQPGFGVLVPSIIGMALFARLTKDGRDHWTTMLDPERRYAPRPVSLKISALKEEEFAVTGQSLAVRPYLIQRNGLRQTLWLDKYGLPVRVEDEAGLMALEDRYVRHR